MKSAAKVPFKNKKTPYNLNEVDVNLLLKNPSSIRKVVKGNNEEHYHDEDESEDDEEKDEGDDKMEAHMKRYISEYFDNKYNKEKDQRKKVKQRMDIIDKTKGFIPSFPFSAIEIGRYLDEKVKKYKSKNNKE